MDSPHVFLLPGESLVCKDGEQIKTVLGTCVSVCIYNKTSGMSGMNHFIYPTSERKNVEKGQEGDFGDLSTEGMILEMMKVDPCSKHYIAQVYGGGMASSNVNKHFQVAQQNLETAKRILKKYNIAVENWDVENPGGVRIHFDTIKKTIQKQNLSSSHGYQNKGLRKFGVLVVEDSTTYATLLCGMIKPHPRLEVIATAKDAYEAREAIINKSPDVMTLDLDLPQIGGLKFLSKVMKYSPIPVVVISSLIGRVPYMSNRCLMSGAKGCLDKKDLSSDSVGLSDNLVTKELLKAVGGHNFPQ